jgi:hypothetical protein
MSKDKFIGAWKLVSFTKKSSAGQISYPYGPEALGYIIYAKEGVMSATIMRAGRQPLGMPWEELNKGKSLWSKLKNIPAILRYVNAAQNYLSYCGPYEIDDKKVTHHVLVCLLPDWLGKDLVRYYEFAANFLILSALDAEGANFELRWERIGQ